MRALGSLECGITFTTDEVDFFLRMWLISMSKWYFWYWTEMDSPVHTGSGLDMHAPSKQLTANRKKKGLF